MNGWAGWERIIAIIAVVLFLLAIVSDYQSHRAAQQAVEVAARGQAESATEQFRQCLFDELTGARFGQEGRQESDGVYSLVQGCYSEAQSLGLRYLALPQAGLSFGTPLTTSSLSAAPSVQIHYLVNVNRVRVEGRPPRRHRRQRRGGLWGEGLHAFVAEVEPTVAAELGQTARRSLMLGVVTDIAMLITALAVVVLIGRNRKLARTEENQKRLIALGEMSAALNHEMRNPLASLRGHAQLLLEDDLGENAKIGLTQIVDETIRLEQLSRDLLAFTDPQRLNPTEVLLSELVADLQAPCGVLIRTGHDGKLKVDRNLMHHALSNLVLNAQKASATLVVMTAKPLQAGPIIEVWDNGQGIPESVKERMFDPFVSGQIQGTGLGLAIVKRIAELHRGSVRLGDARLIAPPQSDGMKPLSTLIEIVLPI